jgi:hypothetical protein
MISITLPHLQGSGPTIRLPFSLFVVYLTTLSATQTLAVVAIIMLIIN